MVEKREEKRDSKKRNMWTNDVVQEILDSACTELVNTASAKPVYPNYKYAVVAQLVEHRFHKAG